MMKQRPAIGSTPIARRLRSNATDAERAMWRLLREKFPTARFRRQVPLLSYIVDFARHSARLVIEVDGGQHGGPEDEERDRRLAEQGYRVLRFWNHDVLENKDGAAAVIAQALDPTTDSTPTQPSPIEGEG